MLDPLISGLAALRVTPNMVTAVLARAGAAGGAWRPRSGGSGSPACWARPPVLRSRRRPAGAPHGRRVRRGRGARRRRRSLRRVLPADGPGIYYRDALEMLLLVFAALGGSFMFSYTTAKAEAMGVGRRAGPCAAPSAPSTCCPAPGSRCSRFLFADMPSLRAARAAHHRRARARGRRDERLGRPALRGHRSRAACARAARRRHRDGDRPRSRRPEDRSSGRRGRGSRGGPCARCSRSGCGTTWPPSPRRGRLQHHGDARRGGAAFGPWRATALGSLCGAVTNFTLGRLFTYSVHDVPVVGQTHSLRAGLGRRPGVNASANISSTCAGPAVLGGARDHVADRQHGLELPHAAILSYSRAVLAEHPSAMSEPAAQPKNQKARSYRGPRPAEPCPARARGRAHGAGAAGLRRHGRHRRRRGARAAPSPTSTATPSWTSSAASTSPRSGTRTRRTSRR